MGKGCKGDNEQDKDSTSATSLETSSDASDWSKGVATVVGGALVHVCFGSSYCSGNFISYAPAHLRFWDANHHGPHPDALYVFPFYFLGQCLAMPLGPLISQRVGARNTLVAGACIMASGVFFASYATTLSSFLFFYGFQFGFGVGLGYTPPMIAGWSWLPHAKGLVSGGVLAGFGMGGFVFNLLGSYLVNPTGEDPVDGVFPDAVYERFPGMLRTLCVCFVVLVTVGAVLVTEKPAVRKNGKKEAMSMDSLGVSAWEAVRTPQFYLLWVMIVLSASAGLNVVAIHKSFAHTRPALKGDSYQALVGGLGALVNSASRLFWGSLSDKIGFKTSFTVLTLVQAIVQLLYTHRYAHLSTGLVSHAARPNPSCPLTSRRPHRAHTIQRVLQVCFSRGQLPGLRLSRGQLRDDATRGAAGVWVEKRRLDLWPALQRLWRGVCRHHLLVQSSDIIRRVARPVSRPRGRVCVRDAPHQLPRAAAVPALLHRVIHRPFVYVFLSR